MINRRSTNSNLLHSHNSLRTIWRTWLYALAALVFISSLVELAHDHSAHQARDTADCAICQHAVPFDKVLPTADLLVLLSALYFFCLTPHYQLPAPVWRPAFRSRAPPLQLR